MGKNKSGRKTLYHTDILPHLDEIQELVANGYTEYSIADYFGISEQTFNTYKNKHPELRRAILKGRRHVERLVRSAILELALGGFKTETKDTPKGLVETVKYYPPNLPACLQILRNYKTEDWEEMSEVERNFKERELKVKERLADEKCFSEEGVDE